MHTLDLIDEGPSILTLEKVAKFLRVHPSTIYRLLSKNELPAFKVGREWRFRREAIDHWRADAELRGPEVNYDKRKRSGTRCN